MDYLIRQTINGRGRLERRKILLIVGQAFLLLLLQEILAVIEVSYSYDLSGFLHQCKAFLIIPVWFFMFRFLII